MSGCGENLLGVQQVASVIQACRDVFPGQAGIIRKNVGFAPTVGHQSNYELNREPRASENRLSSQNGWIEYDMVVRHCHDVSGLSRGDHRSSRQMSHRV